jgi:amino acid transporter
MDSYGSNINPSQDYHPYIAPWNNKNGIASIILGILSITFFWLVLPGIGCSIAALILGHLQLRKNRNYGVMGENAMPVTGIVLAVITLILLAILVFLCVIGTMRNGDMIFRELMNLQNQQGSDLGPYNFRVDSIY